MRLVCPNCGAQYEVPTGVIPAVGRDVQCSACGNTWFQHHPDEEAEFAEAEAARAGDPSAAQASPDSAPGDAATADAPAAGAGDARQAEERNAGRHPGDGDADVGDVGDGEHDGDGTDGGGGDRDEDDRARPAAGSAATKGTTDGSDDGSDDGADGGADGGTGGVAQRRTPGADDGEDPDASPALTAGPDDSAPSSRRRAAAGGAGSAATSAGSVPDDASRAARRRPPSPDEVEEAEPGDDRDQTGGLPAGTSGERAGDAPESQLVDSAGHPTTGAMSSDGSPDAPADALPPPSSAAPLRRRTLDPDVQSVLREEAARAAQGQGGLESQPDLGLADPDPGPRPRDRESRRGATLRDAPPRGDDPLPTAPADTNAESEETQAGSRRDLLPDIEEINSTLRSKGEHRPDQARAANDTPEAHRQNRGFRLGFGFMLLLTALLIVVYVRSDWIAEAMPALRAPLEGFVAAVNAARLWLDGAVQDLLRWLNGLIEG